jgi:hypothetical protein
MPRLFILLGLVCLASCGDSTQVASLPNTIPELRDVAVSSRDEAQAAQEAKDLAAAKAAAETAEAAVKKLGVLLAQQDATSEDEKANQEAEQAGRKARYFAELAQEQKDMADALASWKARTYRSARGLALGASWKAMSLAAEQAGKSDLKSLPAPVQQAARDAARLSQEFSGRQPLDNGQPDWAGIAADLNGYSQSPPAEEHQFLAVAFLLAGQANFGLYEIDMLDATALKSQRQREWSTLARALIYSSHRWRHSAVLACQELVADGDAEASAQLLAGVHLFLAGTYLQGKDHENADRELVRAMRVWPNNPVSVYLTGECLAANGEREKAAKSLEAAAAGTKDEWLAKKVAERARQIRDGEIEDDTLFHDREFVTRVALHYLAVAAKESPWAAHLQGMLEAADSFGHALMAKLPGAK